jgi:hypothetical protein
VTDFKSEGPSGAQLRRVLDDVDRLAQGLAELGFEPTHLGASSTTGGVVDVALSTMQQMAGLLRLQNGWDVQAGRLIHGMVIDYSSMQLPGDPDTVEVQDVVHTGVSTGLVIIYGADGWQSPPVAEDFPFTLVHRERSALEETVVAAEQQRLSVIPGQGPSRSTWWRRNSPAPRRFEMHRGGQA